MRSFGFGVYRVLGVKRFRVKDFRALQHCNRSSSSASLSVSALSKVHEFGLKSAPAWQPEHLSNCVL